MDGLVPKGQWYGGGEETDPLHGNGRQGGKIALEKAVRRRSWNDTGQNDNSRGFLQKVRIGRKCNRKGMGKRTGLSGREQ